MFNNIFCLATYLIMAFILLLKVRLQPVSDSESIFKRLNSLRGIFALEIIIGHCVRYDNCLLTPLGNFMLISVGFFFFVSGFGLARSVNTKPDYLKSFIRHRIVHLILVALAALVFTSIIAFVSPVKTDFAVIPDSIPGIPKAIIYRTNWYIRELLIFYLFFYVIYRFAGSGSSGKLKKLILLSFSILILFIPLYFTGYTRCWFASAICFPAGIAVYEYYDKIFSFLSSVKGKMISIILLLCGLVLSLLNYPALTGLQFKNTEMIYAGANNLMCLGFILMLTILVMYFFTGNALLNFFTRYSTELYLFQFVLVTIAEKMQLSFVLKVAFVLILDIIISLILHPLFKRIK